MSPIRATCRRNGDVLSGWATAVAVESRSESSSAFVTWSVYGIRRIRRRQMLSKAITLSSKARVGVVTWRVEGLPVRQRIDYKLAVLTYKIRNTSAPAYLSHHIRPRESTRHLCSSAILLLHRSTTRTYFANWAFRCSAPAVWNSFNTDTLCSSSLGLFKRSSKTFLFHQTFRPSSDCIAPL